MKGFLKIVTKDPYLGQKLRLELCESFDRIEIASTCDGHADALIYDCRLGTPIPIGDDVYYIAENAEASLVREKCLPLPLPLGLAEKMLKSKKTPLPFLLLEKERALRLYGEVIRLTEVEYSLLSVLVAAGGAFISRAELRAAVWGAEGTDGLLSVYIHYLREKLERGGEKVILSSRKSGYALAEKFARGKSEC